MNEQAKRAPGCFKRKVPNHQLTIMTESELNDGWYDYSWDIVAMTEQAEWS